MIHSKYIKKLTRSLSKMPLVGKKMAEKMAFYIAQAPDSEIEDFLDNISEIRKNIKKCSICHYLSENNSCLLCDDLKRDQSLLCVVEKNEDIFPIEASGIFCGFYHILQGVLSPTDGVTPSDINIGSLMNRVKNNKAIREIIVATSPTVNGELTANYLLRSLDSLKNSRLLVSRIGFGLAIGSELSYVDKLTMSRSLQHRTVFKPKKSIS